MGEKRLGKLGKGSIMLGQLDHDAKFGFYSKCNRKLLQNRPGVGGW